MAERPIEYCPFCGTRLEHRYHEEEKRKIPFCPSCGDCLHVCPQGCIHLEDKRPVWDYSRCANCMACIQACPTKAIQFMTVKEPNPDARYRNPHIALKEIIQANRQI